MTDNLVCFSTDFFMHLQDIWGTFQMLTENQCTVLFCCLQRSYSLFNSVIQLSETKAWMIAIELSRSISSRIVCSLAQNIYLLNFNWFCQLPVKPDCKWKWISSTHLNISMQDTKQTVDDYRLLENVFPQKVSWKLLGVC